MKPITNTRQSEVNPQWLHGANPSGILAQEARGQKELVQSMQLPTDVPPADKQKLVDAGVIFGEQSAGDTMFVDALLPKGWSKRPTDHSMWNELVDDKGVVRAKIFYKAAFYDRRAFMNVV